LAELAALFARAMGDGTVRWKWRDLSRLDFFEGYLFIYLGADQIRKEEIALLIPARAFANAEEARRAFEALKSLRAKRVERHLKVDGANALSGKITQHRTRGHAPHGVRARRNESARTDGGAGVSRCFPLRLHRAGITRLRCWDVLVLIGISFQDAARFTCLLLVTFHLRSRSRL
jgi:hypothetical protein